MIITIDGPTASGKSSIARLIAKELGIYYLYSGVFYRVLGYRLLHEMGYTLEMLHNPAVDDVKRMLSACQFTYFYDQAKAERALVNNIDITPFLKNAQIDEAASVVSTCPRVRQIVDHAQRKIATLHDVVVDGRDAGSVVFPEADYKFFLSASLEVRANRWLGQQKKNGTEYTREQAAHIIAQRDSRDSSRNIAPLKIPVGAAIIDNSDMNLDQTVALFLAHIKLARKKEGYQNPSLR